MRILHINCNYLGTTLHQLMIDEFDKRGIESEVFVPTYDSNKRVIEANKNVFVSECFNKWDRVCFDYKQKKIIKAIEEHYDLKKFDLIHAYTLFTDGNCARILSKKYGIPFIVAVRNTDVNYFLKKMIYLRRRGLKTIEESNSVFFLSDAYKKEVFTKYIPEKMHFQTSKKVKIIANGIDEFWIDNTPSDSNKYDPKELQLIYVGGIDKNKNISATQQAMSILEKRDINVHLTVVGKIVDKREYNCLLTDKNTTFVRACSKEKLIEYYRNSNIFVMPSLHESFGLVYAEAMSQGLPVLYSKGQGFDGQFEEGEVGFHIEPTSPKDIADKITDLLENIEEYSERNICKAKKFSWKRIGQEYFDIYMNIGRGDDDASKSEGRF